MGVRAPREEAAKNFGALGLETVRFPLIHCYCPNRREIEVLGCRSARARPNAKAQWGGGEGEGEGRAKP